MNFAKLLFLMGFLLSIEFCHSQTTDDPLENQQSISKFENDNQALQDASSNARLTKIDLNRCTRDELEALGVLIARQIDALLQHRAKHGKLLSVYELKAVPEFTDETIELMVPYVYVADESLYFFGKSLRAQIAEEDNNFLMARVERTAQPQKGYSSGTSQQYLGNPYKYFLRYKLSDPQSYSIGVTLEKDAGEQLVFDKDKAQLGFDHLLAHFQIKNKGRLKNLVLGNYCIGTGQGLVFANGMYIAKSAEPILFVKRNQKGVLPYNSLLESGYFKGAAATFSHKALETTVLLSQRLRDSEIQTDSGDNFIATIYNMGFHRTAREFAYKNTLGQVDLGFNSRLNKNNFNIGISSCYTSFYNPLSGAAVLYTPTQRLYNYNTFRGRENFVTSIDFNYYYQNINIFGEMAQQLQKGRAVVLGSQVALGPKVDMAVLYRNYNPYFNSFYANGFGEYFNNNDEQGLYLGCKFTPSRKWTFGAYFDMFQNKQFKYGQYAAGQGKEYLLSFDYKPHKKVLVHFQIREESKLRNYTSNTETYQVADASRSVAMLSLKYDLEKHFSLQTKLYHSAFDQNVLKEKGLVLAQDLVYKARRWSLAGRVAIFDTDGYNTRIYIYEKDVQYAFSFPAYQGKGLRYFAILQYNVNERLKFWFRWAHTQYHDRSTVGSVGETIEGSQVDDFKLQLKWMFGKR
jgi:Helix-hairpin-helix motif